MIISFSSNGILQHSQVRIDDQDIPCEKIEFEIDKEGCKLIVTIPNIDSIRLSIPEDKVRFIESRKSE